jgi:hypothetical protein
MPAPKQPHFTFEPMEDPTKQIRLLELQQDMRDGLLQFNMFNVDLAEAPSFSALSYEWGQPGNEQSVLVNRQTFRVQENLAIFLQSIHEYFGHALPITIWVDAIAINQYQDGQLLGRGEKSQQVQLMGKVYRRADIVLGWLGPEVSTKVLILLKTILLFLKENENVPLALRMALRKGPEVHDIEASAHWLFELAMTTWDELLEELARLVHPCLCPFISSSYWTRLRVIQELFLARDFSFMCPLPIPDPGWGLVTITKREIYEVFLLANSFQQHLKQACLSERPSPSKVINHILHAEDTPSDVASAPRHWQNRMALLSTGAASFRLASKYGHHERTVGSSKIYSRSSGIISAQMTETKSTGSSVCSTRTMIWALSPRTTRKPRLRYLLTLFCGANQGILFPWQRY